MKLLIPYADSNHDGTLVANPSIAERWGAARLVEWVEWRGQCLLRHAGAAAPGHKAGVAEVVVAL